MRLNEFVSNAVEYESWGNPTIIDYCIEGLWYLLNLGLIALIMIGGLGVSAAICILGFVRLYWKIIAEVFNG